MHIWMKTSYEKYDNIASTLLRRMFFATWASTGEHTDDGALMQLAAGYKTACALPKCIKQNSVRL